MVRTITAPRPQVHQNAPKAPAKPAPAPVKAKPAPKAPAKVQALKPAPKAPAKFSDPRLEKAAKEAKKAGHAVKVEPAPKAPKPAPVPKAPAPTMTREEMKALRTRLDNALASTKTEIMGLVELYDEVPEKMLNYAGLRNYREFSQTLKDLGFVINPHEGAKPAKRGKEVEEEPAPKPAKKAPTKPAPAPVKPAPKAPAKPAKRR